MPTGLENSNRVWGMGWVRHGGGHGVGGNGSACGRSLSYPHHYMWLPSRWPFHHQCRLFARISTTASLILLLLPRPPPSLSMGWNYGQKRAPCSVSASSSPHWACHVTSTQPTSPACLRQNPPPPPPTAAAQAHPLLERHLSRPIPS